MSLRKCVVLGGLAVVTFGYPPAVAASSCEVVFYAYDTLMASEGWGTEVARLFERKHHCRARAIPVGDAGQLVSRMALDARSGQSPAQIVVGIDQQVWGKVRAWASAPQAFQPPRWRPEVQKILAGTPLLSEGFVPFDFGVLAFVWDSSSGQLPPRKWGDLWDPQWKRKLLLQDPRVSTPGLGFVLGLREALGASWKERVQSLSGQWLTLAPSWDHSYGMFLKGAAPLVWSYTTSEAYHKEKADRNRYRAIVFEDGNPVQLEGATLIASGVNSPAKREAAEKFIRFLLSREAQDQIALRNWMYPASGEVSLPKSFEGLPQAKKVLEPSYEPGRVEEILKEWLLAAQRGRAP